MGRECSGGRGGDRGRGYKWSWVGFVSMGGGQRNWVLASGLDAVDCTTTWPMCSRLLLSLMQQPAHGSVSGDVPGGLRKGMKAGVASVWGAVVVMEAGVASAHIGKREGSQGLQCCPTSRSLLALSVHNKERTSQSNGSNAVSCRKVRSNRVCKVCTRFELLGALVQLRTACFAFVYCAGPSPAWCAS